MTATIRVGTCSWADKTLIESGRFYPPDVVKDPRKRLAYYASQFPVVEVDSSFYAIPAPQTASGWVATTPQDFVFDVKAFALFTGHGANPKALPKAIREALPAAAREKRAIYAYFSPKPSARRCLPPPERSARYTPTTSRPTCSTSSTGNSRTACCRWIQRGSWA